MTLTAGAGASWSATTRAWTSACVRRRASELTPFYGNFAEDGGWARRASPRGMRQCVAGWREHYGSMSRRANSVQGLLASSARGFTLIPQNAEANRSLQKGILLVRPMRKCAHFAGCLTEIWPVRAPRWASAGAKKRQSALRSVLLAPQETR